MYRSGWNLRPGDITKDHRSHFRSALMAVGLDPGTKETGTTYRTDYLIKGTLQQNNSLVTTAHHTEVEPRQTITLHYNTTTALQ